MKTVYYIGMDIAKQNFQVYGENKFGKKLFNKKMKREKVLEFYANIPTCTVGIEACGGAHYWARELSKIGHTVRLISPKLVKPFVLNNKTDAADAMAICEVLKRSTTHFIAIKTEEQQYIACLHKSRERMVKTRTALVNQMRGFLHEYGFIMPQGINKFRKSLALQYDEVSKNLKLYRLISSMYEEFLDLDARVANIQKEIEVIARTQEDCKRLMEIPGIGPLTATLIVAHYGKATNFQNGRQFASSLGLTPREHSSGGKQKLLGITKRGNCAIRKLLIQGALVIGRYWGAYEGTEDRRKLWYKGIILRRNKFIAAVAQANKTARIVWRILARSEEYNQELA